MRSFSITLQVAIGAKQVEVFEQIVPIDLTSIFTGYGPLPAVTGTQNQTGKWNAISQIRTVNFSDGSSAQEQLTAYEHPNYFGYTVRDFSGLLGLLTDSARGEWSFQNNTDPNITQVQWRYALNARSTLTAPLLWCITRFLWRGYMAKALMLSKQQIENSLHSSKIAD